MITGRFRESVQQYRLHTLQQIEQKKMILFDFTSCGVNRLTAFIGVDSQKLCVWQKGKKINSDYQVDWVFY